MKRTKKKLPTKKMRAMYAEQMKDLLSFGGRTKPGKAPKKKPTAKEIQAMNAKVARLEKRLRAKMYVTDLGGLLFQPELVERLSSAGIEEDIVRVNDQAAAEAVDAAWRAANKAPKKRKGGR